MPSATYRLQITAEFTLFDAAAVVGYLAELGVGAVYVSPLLRSTTGSSHGYDVVDHGLVDPDRGGDAGLARLAQECRAAGLGLIVDIVPNHMGVAVPSENRAWWDVLRCGQASPFARWFDIDWQISDGRVLIPALGDDANLATDLTIADGELRYYEHRYPIAPGTGEGSPAAVHDRQHYRLISFRRADTAQNYRRFFAETDLASLRVEDPAVFGATHAEILRWVSDYGVTGLRVDHPDGLVDPGGYLSRLAAAAPSCWITVEKITEPGERLPTDWPIAGMTGYDALSEVNALLLDPAAEGAMTALYVELTGDDLDFEQQIADGKRLVATTILQAEVRRLARFVPEIDNAVAALTELTIAFPVYRSYLPLGAEYLAHAVQRATARQPQLSAAIEALLPRLSDPTDELCVRFQQLTGAIMAKGVEDTAYYRYTRFIGLNEVGGYPGRFGSGIAEFHTAQQRRAELSPAGMTTLSTHDTKRGEDIRARLAVLAEMPDTWGDTARRLMSLRPIPNAAFGYLLWQTAVALPALPALTTAALQSAPSAAADLPAPQDPTALPALLDPVPDPRRDRFQAYAEKAMREADVETGWVDQDKTFETAVYVAVSAAFDNAETHELITSMFALIEPHSWVNSLSQKVIQLTMPGVPDVYQGSELWEDSLVDPDNRRPVDFASLRAALTALTTPPDLDGTALAKLWVVSRALRARHDHPELFTGYTPLVVDGPMQDHLVAFDRGGAITLATRLPVGLSVAGGWGETTLLLPPGRYRDTFTGAAFTDELSVADALGRYPVALLLAEKS
ncbi:MAG: malto-oligosyltrehalose synthase [Phycicoccus sp.]|nr:malto-oligosyltrehalose synthase [Phycicoccus sp.]NMM35077.1 malto-oligosyltrehalose synthase [Phycicoccus sp.]